MSKPLVPKPFSSNPLVPELLANGPMTQSGYPRRTATVAAPESARRFGEELDPTSGAVGKVQAEGVYRLISGVPVFDRGDGTVQIGLEQRTGLVLHNPPDDAVAVLHRLDGTVQLGEVLRAHRAEPARWLPVLERLLELRFLVAAAEWSFPAVARDPFLYPERDSLVQRHGLRHARSILTARQDAVVIVHGTGRVATAIAIALGTSGIGHVHQRPDRSLRAADMLPPAQPSGISPPGISPAGINPPSINGLPGGPTPSDTTALATHLRSRVPGIRVHLPAAHRAVNLVVLAGDHPPSPSMLAALVTQRISHLAVRAGLCTAVVGPLVLPGRSSCLRCASRHRAGHDNGWPGFEAAAADQVTVPPVQLVGAAVAVAVGEILGHLDGLSSPETVNGTVEWTIGDIAPRRRSWTIDPLCGCIELLHRNQRAETS